MEAIQQELFTPFTKPFLRWVGGKFSIREELVDRVPKNYGRYFECFLGGGSLFFALQPDLAYLSDINPRLIKTYIGIRDFIDDVVEILREHERKSTRKYYDEISRVFHELEDVSEIAAGFIFLNKLCYKGLYQETQQGIFNVSFLYGDGSGIRWNGQYLERFYPKKKVWYRETILDEKNLRNCSKLLHDVNICQGDFSEIDPQEGDFVYFDPPYHEASVKYGFDRFDDKRQWDLFNMCKKLNGSGVFWMVSNSDTEYIKSLYKDFKIETVKAIRSFHSDVSQRKKTPELIIRNYT